MCSMSIQTRLKLRNSSGNITSVRVMHKFCFELRCIYYYQRSQPWSHTGKQNINLIDVSINRCHLLLACIRTNNTWSCFILRLYFSVNIFTYIFTQPLHPIDKYIHDKNLHIHYIFHEPYFFSILLYKENGVISHNIRKCRIWTMPLHARNKSVVRFSKEILILKSN